MSALSVVGVAGHAGFHAFAAALRSSGYFDALEGAGPFTLFATLDSAFTKHSRAVLDKLFSADGGPMHATLGYHFVAGEVTTARLIGKRYRAAVHAGGETIIDGRPGGLRVNAAAVVKPALGARNGVVPGIDALLWPRRAVVPAAS